MIVRDYERPDLSGYDAPFYYAACLACGWCGRPRSSELAAGRDDDNHLAAKLAARADRRGAPAPLTPAAVGSVGTTSEYPRRSAASRATAPSWLLPFIDPDYR